MRRQARQIFVVDDLDGRIREDFAAGVRLRVQAVRGDFPSPLGVRLALRQAQGEARGVVRALP
jgi:hypothetical protein